MTAENPAPTPRKRSAAPSGASAKRPNEGQAKPASKSGSKPVSKPAPEQPQKRPAPPESVADISPEEAIRPSYRPHRSRSSLLATLAGVLIGFAAVGVGIGAWYASQSAQRDEKKSDRTQTASDSDDTPRGPKKTSGARRSVQVRLHTPEPGFLVLVDGVLARTETGELLTTPCEITVERGQHTFTAGKTGWRQAVEISNALESRDLEIDSTFEPFAASSGFVAGPWLNLEVGTPAPLSAFDELGRFYDPFVSPDGLTLWVAGEGQEGRGLYESSRPSQFDEFGPPKFIVLSRGSEAAFSPSATADGNLVAYCFKNRVMGLTRPAGEDEFNDKPLLKRSPHEDSVCLAAWLSPDGKRLYWNEEYKGTETAYLVSRGELTADFGRSRKFVLPGGTPNLSGDELRQYTFDGRQLKCFERTSSDGEFRNARVVASIELPGYQSTAGRRQFCVSDDEQWMYYAANPDSAGQLFVVRLTDAPKQGFVPIGKPIESRKPTKSVEEPAMVAEKPAPQPAAPVEPVVDPRSLPLPYAAFREKFSALLKERKVAAAAEWLDSRRAAPELAPNAAALGWDADDLRHIERFWAAADKSAAGLKAGETIRVSGVNVEFLGFANGTLTVKTKTSQVEKKLLEMNQVDLVPLAERSLDKAAADDQLAIGTVLFYEAGGPSAAGNTRLQKAGPAGAEFLDRQGRRVVQLIEQEFARDNVAAALHWIEETERIAPKTPSAATAAGYQEKIYTFVKWQRKGPRDWSPTAEGEYTAAAGKQAGSLLLSPHEYSNFELSLEWKTTASTGQGGVYFRYPGKGKPLETAFKIHLANDAGVGPDKFCTGSLFNVASPTANKTKPAGAWNTLQMRVEGDRVKVTINGDQVLETTASSQEIPSTGFVALDGELGGIVYRKILLIELPDGK
ncbi:MAG TPA: family 16 glycoside hydrolase [Planctomycetaceae bacterium]|nr:family 16 glycoside hydrolase [Planctomycetaceae bacterium]